MNRFGKLFTSAATGRLRSQELAAEVMHKGARLERLFPLLRRKWTAGSAYVIMIALGVGFAGTMIGLSLLLGPKNPTPEKLAPYECGMPAVGDARERHSVKFYLVAMIFLLFDIEIAFLYPWALALRDLGWSVSSRS